MNKIIYKTKSVGKWLKIEDVERIVFYFDKKEENVFVSTPKEFIHLKISDLYYFEITINN